MDFSSLSKCPDHGQSDLLPSKLRWGTTLIEIMSFGLIASCLAIIASRLEVILYFLVIIPALVFPLMAFGTLFLIAGLVVLNESQGRE